MRNGNVLWTYNTYYRPFLSYRTYEERKQEGKKRINKTFQSSYRTYEEWKLHIVCTIKFKNQCSYRTYEEWKQQLMNEETDVIKVLTVPMRNGNYQKLTYIRNNLHVLTVPMRNGNVLLWRFLKHSNLVLTVPMRNGNTTASAVVSSKSGTFLPYLWGMETIVKLPPLTVIPVRSYRTYEEWKQHFPICCC